MKRATLTDVAKRAGVSVTTASYILNGRTTQMRISDETARRVRAGDRGAGLPAQPQRPEPAAFQHPDDRRDLRLRRQRRVRQPDADRGECGRPGVRPPARHRRDDGRPGRRGAADRGHARPPGRRHHLPDPGGLAREGAGEAARRAARCCSTASTPTATCPPCCPTTRPAAGRPASTCSRRVCRAGLGGRRRLDARVDGRARSAARHHAGPRAGGQSPWPGWWRVRGTCGRRATRCTSGCGSGQPARALVCLNDRIAMGAYQALAEFGLDVPRDVSVISFDGSDLASWLRPRLTSLALPFLAMGTLAVENLLEPGPGPTPASPGCRSRWRPAHRCRGSEPDELHGRRPWVWDSWWAYDERRAGTTCSTCTRPRRWATPSCATATPASATPSGRPATGPSTPDPLPAPARGPRRPRHLDGLHRPRATGRAGGCSRPGSRAADDGRVQRIGSATVGGPATWSRTRARAGGRPAALPGSCAVGRGGVARPVGGARRRRAAGTCTSPRATQRDRRLRRRRPRGLRRPRHLAGAAATERADRRFEWLEVI